MGGKKLDRGYSRCSPIAYNDKVIVTVGGPGQAVVAFRQTDGEIVWKKHDFIPSPASPLLIDVDGQEQLVVFMANEIVGLNPTTGDLLWSHPHVTKWGLNISTPVWGEDNLLFCSSAYGVGSRVLKLSRNDDKTIVEELWHNPRIRIHFGSVVRIGDYLYGTSGDFAAVFLCAIDVKTGKMAWQQRFPRASLILADNKLFILDEGGGLTLASVDPTGLKILAETSLFSSRSWTIPTLVGKTLYLRDRKLMMAVDVGS